MFVSESTIGGSINCFQCNVFNQGAREFCANAERKMYNCTGCLKTHTRVYMHDQWLRYKCRYHLPSQVNLSGSTSLPRHPPPLPIRDLDRWTRFGLGKMSMNKIPGKILIQLFCNVVFFLWNTMNQCLQVWDSQLGFWIFFSSLVLVRYLK